MDANLEADNPFADPQETAAATLHLDWTMRQYLEHEGRSRSYLWDLLMTSPYEMEWGRDRRESAAMRMGTAIHTAVLEPHLLDTHYTVWDVRDENGKLKARNPRHKEYAAFLAAATANGQEVLTEEEWATVQKVREYVVARKGVRALLDGGMAEKSVTWRDPKTGEWCKARPDFVDPNRGWVIDLKKCDAPNMWKRGQLNLWKALAEVEHRGYHMQAAMIREGLSYVGIDVKEHWLMWVRSEGAPLIAMTRLQADHMKDGHELFREGIDLYHKCKQSGEWPAPAPQTCDLPYEKEL